MPRQTNYRATLSKPSLLSTESAEEYRQLHKAVEREIKPRGIIEQIYVADICAIVWETLRLRRAKQMIISAAYRNALENLLTTVLRKPGQYPDAAQSDAEALAAEWFTSDVAKKKIAELLAKAGLDESAIEANAVKMTIYDLEILHKLEASLESRRSRALRSIREYRESLASQLRHSSGRLLGEKKDLARLECVEDHNPAAA